MLTYFDLCLVIPEVASLVYKDTGAESQCKVWQGLSRQLVKPQSQVNIPHIVSNLRFTSEKFLYQIPVEIKMTWFSTPKFKKILRRPK